ncbi:MAG: hypothetical protein IBX52_07320 [Bacterioplanes sp.]|nr:hypothetical protein [Bacterioplanes sp.]
MSVYMPVHALELRGVGSFETLGSAWFLVAMYTDLSGASRPEVDAERGLQDVHKLELRVVAPTISVRRFEQLWLDALSIALPAEVRQDLQSDMGQFLAIMRGPLKQHDQILLERSGDGVRVSLNYREHGHVSVAFLDALATSLTARVSAVPIARQGLLGMLSDQDARRLLVQFDQSEPSLQRISETARWLRRREVQVSGL